MIRSVHHFLNVDPAMKFGAADKRKDVLHHVLSQTVDAVRSNLVSRQMIVFLLLLLVPITIVIALNAQCPLRRLGHDPDIKKCSFSGKLVDSPQRNASSLSGAAVPESNELFADDILRETRN